MSSIEVENIITYDAALMRRFETFCSGLLLLERVDMRALRADHGGESFESDDLDPAERLPIKAWRSVYAQMGVNPTKVRNAAEALARRVKKSGSLPAINPIVDVCNHAAVRHAIPIAAVDISRLPLPLRIAQASGVETFSDISGNQSTLTSDEITYFDADGNVHARYWNHKQSAASAVRETSSRVLITIEGMHAGSEDTVRDALEDVLSGLHRCGVSLDRSVCRAWLWRAGGANGATLAEVECGTDA